MKHKIFKYTINNNGLTELNLPTSAMIIKVAYQGSKLCIWATVNKGRCGLEPMVSRAFEVVGTGHEFGTERGCHCHLETVFEGPFVWHVFEVFI